MTIFSMTRARATFANVTAMLALVVALGGGSFAVAALSGSEKKVVKKIVKKQANKRVKALAPAIADEQISKRAPGLTVGTAKNANTLDGIDSGAFARSDRFRTGAADGAATTPQLILSVSGLNVTTDGDADGDATVRIDNQSGSRVAVVGEATFTLWSYESGMSQVFPLSANGYLGTLAVSFNTDRFMMLTCGSFTGIVECSAQLSPAL